MRSRVRDALGPAADEVRILYGGSVKAVEHRRAHGAARHRRRAGRRGEPRPGRVRSHRALRDAREPCRRSRPRRRERGVRAGRRALADRPHLPPGRACHPRRLGLRAAGLGQRRRARRHADLRPPVGELPARHARRLRRSGRPAGGPDGQLRGRPPEHRRREGRLPGSHAHQQGHRRRRLLRKPGAQAGLRHGARATQRVPSHGSRLGRRRALRHGPPQGLPRHGPPRRRGRRRRARLPRRPRHAAAQLARLSRRDRGAHAHGGRGQVRYDQRPLLRHGPRQPLGRGSSSPTTRSSTERASRRPTRRRPWPPPPRAARPTSSCGRP